MTGLIRTESGGANVAPSHTEQTTHKIGSLLSSNPQSYFERALNGNGSGAFLAEMQACPKPKPVLVPVATLMYRTTASDADFLGKYDKRG